VPSDIHDDEVEVTESRDVIETAEEVKGEPANDEDESALPSQDLLSLQTVSWFRQLATVLKKNFLLLSRRPVTLAVMLLSSIVSVLLAWAAGYVSDKRSCQNSCLSCFHLRISHFT